MGEYFDLSHLIAFALGVLLAAVVKNAVSSVKSKVGGGA